MAAPREPCAGGQGDFSGNGGAGFFHKPGQISAAHIALYDDASFAVLAADLIGPLGAINGGEIGQRPRGRNVRGVWIAGELGAFGFRVSRQWDE